VYESRQEKDILSSP